MYHQRGNQLGRHRALMSTNVLLTVSAISLSLNFVLFSVIFSLRYHAGITNGKTYVHDGSLGGVLERSLDRSPIEGIDKGSAALGSPQLPKPDQHNDSGSSTGYDPKKCSRMVNGHCDDEGGGAWRYRDDKDECTYVEGSLTENNAPKDWGAMEKMPDIFPDIRSVMDFGGGPGTYLTGFRNRGIGTLVTVEPHPLGTCLFANVTQDTTDWVNTPLS